LIGEKKILTWAIFSSVSSPALVITSFSNVGSMLRKQKRTSWPRQYRYLSSFYWMAESLVWYLKSVSHVDSPMVKETTLSPGPLASFVVKRRLFWWPPRGEGMSNPRSPSDPVNKLHVLYCIMNTTVIYTQSVKKKKDLFVTARLITPDCISECRFLVSRIILKKVWALWDVNKLK